MLETKKSAFHSWFKINDNAGSFDGIHVLVFKTLWPVFGSYSVKHGLMNDCLTSLTIFTSHYVRMFTFFSCHIMVMALP